MFYNFSQVLITLVLFQTHIDIVTLNESRKIKEK